MTKASTTYFLSKLVVGDAEAMARFYSTAFDLDERTRVEDVLDGSKFLEIILHGGQSAPALVLYSRADEQPSSQDTVLVFNTDDIGSALEAIVAAGGAIKRGAEEKVLFGATMKIAFALDPEGHILQLVQHS